MVFYKEGGKEKAVNVNNQKSAWVEGFKGFRYELFVKNPLGSMALGMMGSVFLSEPPWVYTGIIGSCGLYFGLTQHNEKKREERKSILDHPGRNALIAAAFVAGHQFVPAFDGQYRWNPRLENILALGALMGLTGFFAEVGTRLAKSIAKITYSDNSENKNMFDQGFEHPFIVGAAVGIARVPFIFEQQTNMRDYWSNIPLVMGATMGVTAVGVTVASSLMHSANRSYHMEKRIRRPYYRQRKKWAGTKEAREHFFKVEVQSQERIIAKEVRLEDRIQQTVHLGDLYEQEGDEEQALRYYRKAARLFGRKENAITSRDVLADFLDIGSFYRVLLQDPVREPRSETEFIRAGFRGLVHRDNNVLRYWKELQEQYPEKKEYALLYAKGLEITGKKEEGRALVLRLVQDALRTEGLQQLDRASRNVVGVLKNKILQTEVIVKGTTEQGTLEEEYVWTSYAEELFSGVQDFTVPRPIGILEEGGKTYYVAELEEGEDLYGLMREGRVKRSDMEQALAALAFLHAKMSLKKVQEQERDEIDLLGKRLQQYADIIPISLVVEKLRALQQYIPRLPQVPLKDAQPENFRKNEGICLLDWERVRMGSVAWEYANLLGYTAAKKVEERFTEDAKEQLIGFYRDRMRQLGKKDMGKKEEHVQAYLSIVPIRVLQWFPSLQQRGRKETIETSIANARSAIARVEYRFPDYYQQGKETYQLLDTTLIRLEQTVN